MKTTKLIFYILVFVFASGFSFAQDDVYSTPVNRQSKEKKDKEDKEKLSKRKINTGYVFIDGKFVEPPYKVTRIGLKVLLNGKVIFYSSKPQNPFKLNSKPKMPLESLDQGSKLDEISKIVNDEYNMSYIRLIRLYYLQKYDFDDACDSIRGFYAKLPNVKKVESHKNSNSIFEIYAYNGEMMLFSLEGYGKSYNKTYGVRSKDIYNKKNLKMSAETFVSYISEKLIDKDILFLFTDETNLKSFSKCSIRRTDIFNVYKILESKFADSLKIDSLNRIIFNQQVSLKIIESYNNRDKLYDILNEIVIIDSVNLKSLNCPSQNKSDYYIEKYFSSFGETKKNSNIAYSPFNNEIYAWCPNPWEFTEFNSVELPNIIDYVDNQGYNYNPSNVFTDETPGDNSFGSCTYENLISMKNAGLLYLDSHGDNNYIDIIYAATTSAINSWSSNNQFIHAIQNEPPPSWGNSDMWAAAVESQWVSQNWSYNLNHNKSIVVLSSCNSYNNGWVEACNGGVCFGYSEEVPWINLFFQGVYGNNKNLFKRMNGEKENGLQREASDAYDGFTFSYGFSFLSNYPITLCPTTKFYFPENNDIVPPEVTSGYFETDTWCDASIPANQALSLEFSDGDLSYNSENDVYWDNPVDGRSNKIIYKWSGTHGIIRVNINTTNIVAYGGGGQKIDFDRKTPNEETNAFYVFNVGYSNPNVVDFIASQYEVLENTSIQFTNQSTVYNPISYFWDFGDGTTSTQENPSHTYTNQGIFDVTLRINTLENEFYETKNALITVLTECSGELYATYDFITDTRINFYASYTDTYEPLIDEYRFIIYFGDGTQQTQEGILNMINFEKEYSDYGDYYPVIVVETIDQFGGTICLKEHEMDMLQISNPTPCADFHVDFSISPSVAYLHGLNANPNVTVNFYNTTTGASNNCTWRWDFLSDLENGYEPVGGISTELITSGNGNPQSQQYDNEGFYPVILTATDWNTSCSDNITKLVQVSSPIHCINSLRIIGYDQLYTSNRLIVPWRMDDEECIITLRNSYSLGCILCPCPNSCYNKKIAYNWNINGENIFDVDQVLDYYIEYGADGGENFYDSQITLPTGLFEPYRNTVGCFIKGALSEINSSVSCYDTTNIEIIAINCDGFMDSEALNFAYAALISPFLPSFTLSGFALHNNNKLEFFSGSMNLDATVNQIISDNDVVLYACKEIVLSDGFITGNKSLETKTGNDYIEGCEPVPSYSNCFYDNIAENDVYIENPFLNISPNPVLNNFQINLNHNIDGFVLLEILDSQGRIIKSTKSFDLEASEYSFEVKNFKVQPGVYFCRYTNSETSISTKFIKQ